MERFTPDELRRILVKDIQANWGRLEANVTTLDNWILATLVALNGGATLAVANAATKEMQPCLTWAGGTFVLGAAAAVAGGMLRRSAERRFIDRLLDLRQSIIDPPEQEPPPRAQGSDIFGAWAVASGWRLTRPSQARSRVAAFSLWASIGGYVIGCCLAAVALSGHASRPPAATVSHIAVPR